jgi:hypothetical protein
MAIGWSVGLRNKQEVDPGHPRSLPARGGDAWQTGLRSGPGRALCWRRNQMPTSGAGCWRRDGVPSMGSLRAWPRPGSSRRYSWTRARDFRGGVFESRYRALLGTSDAPIDSLRTPTQRRTDMLDRMSRDWWIIALQGVAALVFGVLAWCGRDHAAGAGLPVRSLRTRGRSAGAHRWLASCWRRQSRLVAGRPGRRRHRGRSHRVRRARRRTRFCS